MYSSESDDQDWNDVDESSSSPRLKHQRTLSAASMTSGSEQESGTARKTSKQQSFIQKLFKMATCGEHSNVFGFSEDGTHLEIRNPTLLGPVLIRYFKHSNTSSFIRQLNNYGFKTISSVATGKSIQCFAHPHFHRDAKDVVDKITRKTAKSMKKCKREIIKELQNGEIEYRKRLRELEMRNQRLEQHNQALDRENKRLVLEIHKTQETSSSSSTQQHLGGGAGITESRRSSYETTTSSSDAEPMLEMNSDYSEESPLLSKGFSEFAGFPLLMPAEEDSSSSSFPLSNNNTMKRFAGGEMKMLNHHLPIPPPPQPIHEVIDETFYRRQHESIDDAMNNHEDIFQSFGEMGGVPL